MDFDRYIKDSWKRHGSEPEPVFDAFPVGRACAQSAGDLVAFAGLVAHVSGEHLGRWRDGIAVLDGVLGDPYLLGDEAALRSVQRSRALLYHGSGDRKTAEALLAEYADTAWPVASSRVRMLASVAAAFAAQGDVDLARSTFEEAVEIASYGPQPRDPAARALAVAANNLAMDLEELESRSEVQDELMVFAARTSRRWWEVAGDVTNVLLADVRVASALLAVGDVSGALPFAEDAARHSAREGTLAGFRIQAMLVLGRAKLASGDSAAAESALRQADEAFLHLPDAYRDYYEPQIETLRASTVGT